MEKTPTIGAMLHVLKDHIRKFEKENALILQLKATLAKAQERNRLLCRLCHDRARKKQGFCVSCQYAGGLADHFRLDPNATQGGAAK